MHPSARFRAKMSRQEAGWFERSPSRRRLGGGGLVQTAVGTCKQWRQRCGDEGALDSSSD